MTPVIGHLGTTYWRRCRLLVRDILDTKEVGKKYSIQAAVYTSQHIREILTAASD